MPRPLPDRIRTLPHCTDGTLDIPAPLRLPCELIPDEVTGSQTDAICEENGAARNGYREGGLKALVGKITLRTPKLGVDTYFPNPIIELYSMQDRTLVAATAL